LRRAGRPVEALTKLEETARVRPEWNGAPLVSALREIIRRATRGGKRCGPDSGHMVVKEGSSDLDSSKIQKELRQRNAAWQFKLEGYLLGRELDDSPSASDAAIEAR
jgi:hypothetical protein